MKIYDISQEVFTCSVFPGDAEPQKEVLLKICDGAVCNLSALHMCAHNGTHVDAPYHFLDHGKKIDEIDLSKFIGWAYVTAHEGVVSEKDALAILEKAKAVDEQAAKKILIKGKAEVSLEAAEVFAKDGIELIGNESQTVGPESAPREVHLKLLGVEMVLLEGIRLGMVEEGVYFLNAAPLNLGGADGAPCRAVLIQF